MKKQNVVGRFNLLFAIILFGSIFFTLSSTMISSAQQTTTHIVQAGETLQSIATIYDSTAEEVAALNGIAVNTVVFAGQQLVVPVIPNAIPTNPAPPGSTAGDVETEVQVIDAGPTPIPITPIPTPLPYDPNRIVSIIEPDSSRRFTVNDQPIPVRGVVQFDPDTMAFWKIEIRSTNRLSRIWQNNDPMQSVPAFDWVTIDQRTDAVIDGPLGVVPAFPTLNRGNWFLRVVAVDFNGNFVDIVEVPFRVRPDFDAVPAFINTPQPDAILQPGDPVTGTALLNWATTSYRVEIIGGNFFTWTTIAHVANDAANPIRIHDGVLTNLPDDLLPGRYRLRLIITGPDSNYIQEPYEVGFAISTDEISNLAEISFTSPRSLANGNRVTAVERVPLIGTVTIPDPNGYYKLEIKDDDRLIDGQEPRFVNWTTVGSIQSDDVIEGVIGEAPGVFTLPVGDYVMRVVVVDGEGNYSAVREFDLRIRD
jgi:hypothetical protein